MGLGFSFLLVYSFFLFVPDPPRVITNTLLSKEMGRRKMGRCSLSLYLFLGYGRRALGWRRERERVLDEDHTCSVRRINETKRGKEKERVQVLFWFRERGKADFICHLRLALAPVLVRLLHDAISAENDNAMCDTRLASHDDEHIRSLVLVTRPHIIRSK